MRTIILLLSLTGAIFTTSSGLLTSQPADARTEEVLDTANNNLKISMQAPDAWNSGKLSATILSVDWKLNGIFAINFGTKLFASSEESIALFAIVNAPSLANAAIPLAQKFGLISLALSQFVTINKESDITLSDGSPGHTYSISASVEQLRKLKAPFDKALDAVLITTQQEDKTYIVIYATESGRMGQYQSVFDNMLNSVTIGTASLAVAGSGVSKPTAPDIIPSQTNPSAEPPSQATGPEVLINPVCGPSSGFEISVTGKGFKPHSSVNWIIQDSDGRAPMGGYFGSDATGNINNIADIDNSIYNGHFKMKIRDDADEDYKLDPDGSIAVVDVTIPCP